MLEEVLAGYDADGVHNEHWYYSFHVRVQVDFFVSLENVDQMIDYAKERYRYTIHEVMELAVLVHVDDYYVIEIRKEENIRKNMITRDFRKEKKSEY